MKYRIARRAARIERQFPQLSRSLQRSVGQLVALACALAVLALVELPLASNPIARATAQSPPSELIQERTETSKTFDNHDGTYTRTVYSGPVHYRDGQRRWQPISSQIVAAEEPGYAWRNEANSFQTLFKSQLAGDFLRFRVAGRAFSFSLQGATDSSVQRRQFGLTYRDVFPNVDLRYDVLADRIKETLVLANAQARLNYRFLLTPPEGVNLRARRRADGSWAIFRRTRAAPLFVFEAPYMIEAGGSVQEQRHVSMTVSESEGQFAIELEIDADWLRDSARQFPIRLDPTIAIQPPVQDATVLPNWSTSLPALTERLPIGVSGGGISASKYQAALQFDLGDIPAGANITDAQLKLYFDGTCITVSGGNCGNTSHQLDLHRMTGSWDPTKTTNGAFVFESPPLTSFTLPNSAPTQWMSWTITSLLQNWVTSAQPNYGVLIKRATEPNGASGPSAPSSRYPETSLGPKLEVTYTGDGVDLLPIESAHSNGAELVWTKWAPPSQATFEKYEIHRSPNARFTPSSSTLLATLRDVAMTSYTDTTAGPNRTFSYRIVANASVSNERRLTLPADGQASKVVQAEPGLARATYIATNYDPCETAGGESKLYVGALAGGFGQKYRALLDFDLRTIPANSTVNSATLALWHPDTMPSAITVNAHALTADWEEGFNSMAPGCGRGGGASWLETKPGIGWQTAGGDFEVAASATVTNASGEQAGWDNYALTGLVQRWVDIETPNHGVLLKAADEANGPSFSYHSNDWTVSPTLRPKLTVSYADGSHALAPTVSVVEPAPSAVVSGAAVRISAEAGDDRRVDQVEFLVGGQVVGTDTSAPYSITWDSRTVANSSVGLTAKATDDAGNVTTSSAVTVEVANSNPPTTSIVSPLNGAEVLGTVPVTAVAADDYGVTKVEFYVDKQLRSTDTSAPYEFSWNTLDPDRTAYDGAHTVHTKAYDAHTNVTASQLVLVTTRNTEDTMYVGTITPFGSPPPDYVVYDPAAQHQLAYPVELRVHNTSTVTWNNVALRYRWYSSDSPSVVTDSTSIPIESLPPDGLVELTPSITAPALPQGVSRAQYRLRLDLYDQTGQRWFAGQGNRPYERQVIVNKALPVGLGREGYYRYEEESIGAGMRHFVNVASGNSILTWRPFSASGRGLLTNVDLTYNSLESASESPVGNNFSLAISSLTRFGLPLEVHPTEADILAGRTNKWIGFVDADGTAHRFEGRVAGDNSVYWEEPAGQHLYLREFSTSDPERKWAMTAPNRTTYFYDRDGYPTYVEDGNGNRLKFTLETVSGSSGVTKRVVAVTDAAGLDTPPSPNRSFGITYYSEGDTRASPVVGRVKRITDHSGSALDFLYYDDGNLRMLTQRGGVDPGTETTPVPDRSFIFGYTTPDGLGPAIPGPLPPDPDPGTEQSTRLSAVRDPRGHSTAFTYVAPTNPQNGWKLNSLQNRTAAATSFGYDTAAAETTVTAPLSRVSKYRYDSEGKVTGMTRPDNQVVTMTWTSDRMLHKTIDPNGSFTERAHNANGQLTDEWDQLRNHTLYEYENLMVDANDVSGKWRSGRAIPHLSQLSAKTEPNGTATGDPNDYRTRYEYNSQGRLTRETDGLGKVTQHTYRPDGTLETTTDANNHTITFADYDANGSATRVIDHAGQVTTYGYDNDGLLRWHQDPNHASYSGGNPRHYRKYYDYDAFHRQVRRSEPKSTSVLPGTLVWSGTEYDANGNAVAAIGPLEGADYQSTATRTETAYDAMDRKVLVTGPDKSVDPAGERTQYEYDLAGRAVRTTSPQGTLSQLANDYTTFFTYDVLDRVIRETQYAFDGNGNITQTRHTYSCYNIADDLVSVTAPRAELSPGVFDCPSPQLPYTTRYSYDLAHRLVTQTDPEGHTESQSYDANGNVTATTNADGKTTTTEFDQYDQVTKIVEPFIVGTAPRDVTTKLEYDAVGNLKREISPRAWDASSDKQTFSQYVTTYHYDTSDQLVRIDLPTSSAYPEPTYIHKAYDQNGKLVSSSLAVTTDNPATVDADQKTSVAYFDGGLIRTAKEPGLERVHFDYTAAGKQESRTAETAEELDLSRISLWLRNPEGQISQHVDAGGHPATYSYDANDNLVAAHYGAGLTSPQSQPIELVKTLDGFGQVTKIRQREGSETDYTAALYTYDLNGNASSQEVNRIETAGGGIVSQGRSHVFTRDEADWVQAQRDQGTTPTDPSDDRRIESDWSATGLETERRRQTWNANIQQWEVKQVTSHAYFANDKLKESSSKNADGSIVYGSHSVSYIDADNNYANGNRTADAFKLLGPGPDDNADCRTNLCTSTTVFDARDRVVAVSDGHGTTTSYTLDPIGNITTENVTSGSGSTTRTFGYVGQQLATITSGAETTRFFYDVDGNLDCVTKGTGSSGDCSPREGSPPSASLLTDYAYDYENRMVGAQSFDNSAEVSSQTFTYDAVDRPRLQVASDQNGTVKNLFVYGGISDRIASEETQTPAGAPIATRRYAYDAAAAVENLNYRLNSGPATDYSIGHDPHGSVSVLSADGSNTAAATYGYKPYGDADLGLTRGNVALSSYRYTGKHFDSGSETYDMGARRFGPDAGRFLQRDSLDYAAADLRISTGLLTQSQYGFAGGNPSGYIENNGHWPVIEDEGNVNPPNPPSQGEEPVPGENEEEMPPESPEEPWEFEEEGDAGVADGNDFGGSGDIGEPTSANSPDKCRWCPRPPWVAIGKWLWDQLKNPSFEDRKVDGAEAAGLMHRYSRAPKISMETAQDYVSAFDGQLWWVFLRKGQGFIRYWGGRSGPKGHWLTRKYYNSPADARRGLALGRANNTGECRQHVKIRYDYTDAIRGGIDDGEPGVLQWYVFDGTRMRYRPRKKCKF